MKPIVIEDDVYEKAVLGWDSALGTLSEFAFDKESQRLLDTLYTIGDKERSLRKKYLELHKKTVSKIRNETRKQEYTSAIIETKPIKGLHYSKSHGISGMGDVDEYGVPSGKVTLDDLTKIYLIKNSKIVKKIAPSELTTLTI